MTHCRDQIFHEYHIVKETPTHSVYVCNRCKDKKVVNREDTRTINAMHYRDILQSSNPMFWFEWGKMELMHSPHLLKVKSRCGWDMPEMNLHDLNKYEFYE